MAELTVGGLRDHQLGSPEWAGSFLGLRFVFSANYCGGERKNWHAPFCCSMDSQGGIGAARP